MVDNCLKNNLYHWLNRLYPPCCVFCGSAGSQGQDLCSSCKAILPFQNTACLQCGAALMFTMPMCGDCLKKPPVFDRTYPLFTYQEPVNSLILKLKFNTRLVYARLLADLWLRQYRDCLDRLPDCIIPIPLHPVRLRERGFNQAVALARPIASALRIPLNVSHCIRTRNTESQTGLSASDRLANVRKAFALKSILPAKRVALLDDVMTTGSTVSALASVLKQSGVEQVDVWVMARAGK